MLTQSEIDQATIPPTIRPANVPETAIPIPPSLSVVPGVQQASVVAIIRVWAHEDANAADIYNRAVTAWLSVNGRNRDMGLPLRPKPEPPFSHQVETFTDTVTNIIWVWITLGPPVGPPCPDLPPIPTPVPGTIAVGVHLFQDWWQCMTADTLANDQTTPPNTVAADGTVGQWKKVAFGPFGSEYQKVA